MDIIHAQEPSGRARLLECLGNHHRDRLMVMVDIRTGERSVAYTSGTAWDMIRCFKAVTTLIAAAIENAYG